MALEAARRAHRPAHRQDRYILCNIPLDVPVDELVTFRALVGDSRLTDALAACEENGWEALPLSPEKLSELFPELWGTEGCGAVARE